MFSLSILLCFVFLINIDNVCPQHLLNVRLVANNDTQRWLARGAMPLAEKTDRHDTIDIDRLRRALNNAADNARVPLPPKDVDLLIITLTQMAHVPGIVDQVFSPSS